jgi:cyclopropane fatty-acyl-phospholipid synthase-like methyltransferase
MINKDFYDKNYFEKGVTSKKSCYLNYRWMPELTIPMAYNIIKFLNLKEDQKILDFGCSKGFLVKSLRLLGIDAYGVDISSYAIDNIDSDVKKYCKLIPQNKNLIPFKFNFDWIISKDVLEHLTTNQISNFLNLYKKKTDKMFHVIPLGDNKKFRIKEYHLDKSHVQMNNEIWWEKIFNKNGWKILSFDYVVKGIKDNWTENHPKGNGFFIIQKI